jgi:hypothetical protein
MGQRRAQPCSPEPLDCHARRWLQNILAANDDNRNRDTHTQEPVCKGQHDALRPAAAKIWQNDCD